MIRVFWLAIGILALGLGVLGIPLPFLPTVPFLLLSAFAFAKSSPRLHQWLISHPKLGPPISDWNERGVIRRRAKIMATITILAALLISLALNFPLNAILGQIAVLICVMIFIWTRPE